MSWLRRFGQELADAWRWFRCLPAGRRGKPAVGPVMRPPIVPTVGFRWGPEDGFTPDWERAFSALMADLDINPPPPEFRRHYLGEWPAPDHPED